MNSAAPIVAAIALAAFCGLLAGCVGEATSPPYVPLGRPRVVSAEEFRPAPRLPRSGSAPIAHTAVSVRPDGTIPHFEDSGSRAARLAIAPEGLERQDQITTLVAQWLQENPAAAAQWIAGLPPGPSRERALEVYAAQALISPRANADLANLLPSPEVRHEVTETIAREWLRTDPAGAEAWLRQTTLPPHRQDRLLREAGRR